MKKCRHCGAELPDGSSVCPHCGEDASSSSFRLPERLAPLLNCFSRLFEGWTKPQTVPACSAVSRDFLFWGGKWLSILVLGIAAVFCILLGSRIYRYYGMGSYRYKNQPVVYLTENNALRFYSPLVREPVTISENLSWMGGSLSEMTVLSPDGRMLLYLNHVSSNGGYLYLRDLTADHPLNSGRDTGTMLATGVAPGSFRFSPDSQHIVYRSSSGSLFCYTKRGPAALDSETDSILTITPSNEVLYTRRENGLLAIYQRSLTSLEQPARRIDAQVSRIWDCTGDGTLIYLKRSRDDANPLSIFRYRPGGEPEQLSDAAYEVLDCGENGEVFFLTAAQRESNPFLFFIDDMAEADALVEQPLEEDFYVTMQGPDGSAVQTLDDRAYGDALRAYDALLKRNDIREAIAARSQMESYYSLYFNDGTSTCLLDDNLTSIEAVNPQNGTAVALRQKYQVEQTIRISAVTSPEDAVQILEDCRENTVIEYFFASPYGKSTTFYSALPYDDIVISLHSDGVYYFVREENNGWDVNGGTLYFLAYSGGTLSEAQNLDGNVSYFPAVSCGGKQLYFRDMDDNMGTLCAVENQRPLRISDTASPHSLTPVNNGSGLMFFQVALQSEETGCLAYFNGSSARRISSLVYDWDYRTDRYLYLLRSYDPVTRSGNLYLYTGSGSLTLLDRGVSELRKG